MQRKIQSVSTGEQQNKLHGEEERTLGPVIKIALHLKQTWSIGKRSAKTYQ